MGDEVNLGARLMSTAGSGDTIVSSDVRRKVQALFELDPRGEVQLKGKSLPVPIFSIAGPRAIPQPLRGLEGMRSPLVGPASLIRCWATLPPLTEKLGSSTDTMRMYEATSDNSGASMLNTNSLLT